MATSWSVSSWVSGDESIPVMIDELWRRDPHRSPFSGTHYLRMLATAATDRGDEVVVARGIDEGGSVVGAWPFILDHRGRLSLLADGHSDHSTCLAADGDANEMADGFAFVLKETGAKDFYLRSLPPWGPGLEACQLGARRAGWRLVAFPAWACPIMDATGPDAHNVLMKKVSGRIRTYENGLRKTPGFAFDAVEDDHDLDRWVGAFCETHEWRWNPTNTPSLYADQGHRRLLQRKLQAWVADGVAVRFGLRVAGKWAAMAIGLKTERRLIYYHTVHSPAAESSNAGTVLIRLMVLWMLQHEIFEFDFGTGTEAYKLRWATRQEPITRAFGSRRSSSFLLLGGRTEEFVRHSPLLRSAWDKVVNRLIRSWLRKKLVHINCRLRNVLKVHLRSPWHVVVGRAWSRVVVDRTEYYTSDNVGESDPEVTALPLFDVLGMLDDEVGLSPGERARYYEIRHRGARVYGIREAGRIVQIAWLRQAEQTEVPPFLADAWSQWWMITDCLTARSARGRGLYPRVLRSLCAEVPLGGKVFMYTSTWNRASQRGITKAGFLLAGWRVTDRRTGERVWRSATGTGLR